MEGVRIDRFASVSDYPQFSCGDFCNLLVASRYVCLPFCCLQVGNCYSYKLN